MLILLYENENDSITYWKYVKYWLCDFIHYETIHFISRRIKMVLMCWADVGERKFMPCLRFAGWNAGIILLFIWKIKNNYQFISYLMQFSCFSQLNTFLIFYKIIFNIKSSFLLLHWRIFLQFFKIFSSLSLSENFNFCN